MSEYTYSPTTGLGITSKAGFKTIWVVDSIPAGELATAKELFEDDLYYRNVQDPGFNIEYERVNNRTELFAALDKIHGVLQKTGAIPLIHFETHGNPDALVLSSKEAIRYEELFPALSRINIDTQNSLFVVAAACHGALMGKVMVDAARSPFWAILGPARELSAENVLQGNRAFYNALLKKESWNDSLRALRLAIPEKGDSVAIWTSEHLFLLGFRYYFGELCEGPGLEERIKGLVERACSEKRMGRVQATYFADELRRKFQSPEHRRLDFETARDKFFMHDLYPSNQNLPRPAFERVMQINHMWKQ